MLSVIYEDADLLVVQKPAGLVCHPTKQGELSSLIGRARLYLSRGGCGAGGEQRPIENEAQFSGNPPALETQNSNSQSCHLVNRIDRETSGVMLIAKNSRTAGELGKILEGRAVEKEYLAIVHGHVAAESGVIDAPLGRDEGSRVVIKDCVRSDGAQARTDFVVLNRFRRIPARRETSGLADKDGKELSFSLLRLQPQSGRKHQIRIHLAHLGHPIVGDKLYGRDEDCYLALVQNRLTEIQKAKLIFENHALHARAVRFAWRGRSWNFTCEPEAGFVEFSAPKPC